MLNNWLSPISKNLAGMDLYPFQMGKHLELYAGEIPNLEATRVAIIGLENKGTEAIRSAFYRMAFAFEGLRIADLGNIRKSDVQFIIPLVRELIESNICPVVIGADPSFCQAQFKAFFELKDWISLAVADEQVAINPADPADHSAYLNPLALDKKTRLYHLACLGCQAHYMPPEVTAWMESRYFESVRLGRAKSDLSELEPVIRDADLFCFQLSALKQAEMPAQFRPSPSGFSLEEACQICRYAGMSDKLRAFGIYGYQPGKDFHKQGAEAIAQMLWYFMDGFFNRKGDYPVSTDGLVEYIVDTHGGDHQVTFWKSNRSGRWWIQAPVRSHKKFQRHRLIPCSYNDYKLACQDELPDRLIQAFKRFD